MPSDPPDPKLLVYTVHLKKPHIVPGRVQTDKTWAAGRMYWPGINHERISVSWNQHPIPDSVGKLPMPHGRKEHRKYLMAGGYICSHCGYDIVPYPHSKNPLQGECHCRHSWKWNGGGAIDGYWYDFVLKPHPDFEEEGLI